MELTQRGRVLSRDIKFRSVVLQPVSKPTTQDDLKSLPMSALQAKLGSTAAGLSEAEAKKRLTRYRPNEISEKKTNEFLKFLTYFWGPIPWMIETAVILSGVARHGLNFFIILLPLCSNAVVGFWKNTRRATPSRRSRPSWRSSLFLKWRSQS
jgi:magnesium-transporting ATPase (P-type)